MSNQEANELRKNIILNKIGSSTSSSYTSDISSVCSSGSSRLGVGALGDRLVEKKPVYKIQVTVTEGKHRMVRRMLHNAGHSVLGLRRLRYGQICLLDDSRGSILKCADSDVCNPTKIAEGYVRRCNDDEKEWAVSLYNKQKKMEMKQKMKAKEREQTGNTIQAGTGDS